MPALEFDLYEDMKKRTNGEIYIGVVGPVRTGKSTFIKRFMDYCILPGMTDYNEKNRTIDEMPQSASGITVTTTEPKFIPGKAESVFLDSASEIKIRLIDCVGFMIHGAMGHMEGDEERLVKTPWSEEEISFTKAAEIGTQKVIEEHSTVGVVITSDGSFGEFTREAYLEAEMKAIENLKRIGKPFIVILNSVKPFSDDTQSIVEEMKEKYQVSVVSLNCMQLKREDLDLIMKNILYEFPVRRINFIPPSWFSFLDAENEIIKKICQFIKTETNELNTVSDVERVASEFEDIILDCHLTKRYLSEGKVEFTLDLNDKYYYDVLSEIMDKEIRDDFCFVDEIKKLVQKNKLLDSFENAISSVQATGYGVVIPKREEIKLEKPELVKNGNKYGIKIIAHSPSIHFIKSDIECEISPIVGSEEQAKELIEYINKESENDLGVWNANVFGKTIEELIFDGIRSKINSIGEDCQVKLQGAMTKIVNDSNGGMVCIII